jgi:hypothetical protein
MIGSSEICKNISTPSLSQALLLIRKMVRSGGNFEDVGGSSALSSRAIGDCSRKPRGGLGII